MAGKLRVPRSRGAVSGILLVLLGAWGGLIAFIGPYFHYAYSPASAWTYTTGRLWLEILPGASALVGGLVVLISRLRPIAMLGAWVAAVSGAWFAAGTTLIPLWAHGAAASPGTPTGGTVARVVEQIGFFTGLGVVIVFVAAAALGKLMMVAARDVRAPASGPQATDAKTRPIRTPAPAGQAAASSARTPLRATAAPWRRISLVKKATPESVDAERTEPANLSS
jgi:hypothetical protein